MQELHDRLKAEVWRLEKIGDKPRRMWQEAVVRWLKEQAHKATHASLTLSTGLRAANVTGLTWQQVDLERKLAWVHPDQAKGRRAIPVPLNEAALRTLEKQIGKHPTIVFTCSGHGIEQVSTAAWYKALKRAGIEDFRWHDLRHTWASWAVQSGVPLFALQEMAGWETPGMARRYAHVAAGHLAAYADKMPSVHGTNLAQGQK